MVIKEAGEGRHAWTWLYVLNEVWAAQCSYCEALITSSVPLTLHGRQAPAGSGSGDRVGTGMPPADRGGSTTPRRPAHEQNVRHATSVTPESTAE